VGVVVGVRLGNGEAVTDVVALGGAAMVMPGGGTPVAVAGG
jgi:hypothetical protein